MIPFTQYLMPDGRRQQTGIERPEEVERKAREILDAGLFFELELLSDWNTVSLTVADRKKEEDVAIVLCQNGPQIPDAVDRLVEQAFALLPYTPMED